MTTLSHCPIDLRFISSHTRGMKDNPYNDYYGMWVAPPAEPGDIERLPGATLSVGVYLVLGLFGAVFLVLALAGAIPIGFAIFLGVMLGVGAMLARRRAKVLSQSDASTGGH